MSVIRCKVRVYSVFQHRKENSTELWQEQINIGGVYSDDPESENRKWSTATPQFNLSMTINNPGAFGKLEQNKEYYLDFIEADSGPTSEAQ